MYNYEQASRDMCVAIKEQPKCNIDYYEELESCGCSTHPENYLGGGADPITT